MLDPGGRGGKKEFKYEIFIMFFEKHFFGVNFFAPPPSQ